MTGAGVAALSCADNWSGVGVNTLLCAANESGLSVLVAGRAVNVSGLPVIVAGCALSASGAIVTVTGCAVSESGTPTVTAFSAVNCEGLSVSVADSEGIRLAPLAMFTSSASSFLGKSVGAFGFAIGDTLPVVTLNCVGKAIIHPYCGAGTSGLGSAVAVLGAGTVVLPCAVLVFGAGTGGFGCAVNVIIYLPVVDSDTPSPNSSSIAAIKPRMPAPEKLSPVKAMLILRCCGALS